MVSRWLRETADARLGFVRTGGVISERESQHDGEPEDRANDDELGALGAVAGVHEVENDERSLNRGDGESDDDIEWTEIPERGPDGEPCADH